ncbi:MmgE/PrpD family protein [Pigmentiphaga soli]|uniref:MmgE/PrpD family protein n=1 Tax=Pigmentiphaga soli TaxID=1007095 RepID=A0ABP8GGD6_9BURK
MLDIVAVAVAGIEADAAQACRQALADAGIGSGSSCVFGTDSALPPALAALVNGTAAHALELDGFGGGHAGAVVVPAVLAVAQTGRYSGEEVLTAIVAGFDVMSRVTEGAGGYRAHNDRGWHNTGTCGTFGAAAAVARLMGLDAMRFAAALGIAGTFTGGTWAYLADGAMTKRVHSGKAAEAGVMAAFFARAGMTGPRFVLEAPWGGFFPTYCGADARPERVLAKLGENFWIERSGIKPYACCRAIHSGIDALFDLMAAHSVTAADIVKIEVHCDETAIRQLGGRRIDTLLDAQLSLPYSLAVAAATQRAGLAQYSPPNVEDSEVQRLMRATELIWDRALATGASPTVRIALQDGRTLSRSVEFAKGAPENPLTDDELRAKALQLLELRLNRERAEALVRLADRIEASADAGEWIALLRP